jgi:hypothetical protein
MSEGNHELRTNGTDGASTARTRQLTIEVPDALAEHIALCCARRGAQMAELLRQLVEREFPSAD